MNVSYLWLKELVPTNLGVAEVAQTLTRVGLNVDNVTELPGGDACLLVEVTSNRPDCLGHIGVARELAAALGVAMKLPDATIQESADTVESLTSVEVVDPNLCPLYTARVVRGVRVGPSPAWLAQRLEAIGIRPVNNIVDITNYVMFETGQPLHAFDYAKLGEHRIVVRRAAAGERFIAIDHTEHTLTPDRLVIADARRAVALAGVMGGAETEISAATTDVLLEAAVFDPQSVHRTARALAMFSEASYRFERRVDPHGTDWASRRCCRLFAEVAGGRPFDHAQGGQSKTEASIAGGVAVDGNPLPPPAPELTLRIPRIKTLLGLEIPARTAADILARLECKITEATGDRIRVVPPSWRPDLERETDLIEEVARHHGYDKIPEQAAIRVSRLAVPTKTERVRDLVGRILTAAGYFEAVTFTFTTPAHAVRLRRGDVTADPLTCRAAPLALRESLTSGVLESLAVNRRAGEPAARLFEVAKRFIPVTGQDLPQEDPMLALAGGEDFEAVRGTLEELFTALRLSDRIKFSATNRYPDLDAGASAEILLGGQTLGMVGRLTKDAAKAFDLDEPPYVAEVHYGLLVAEASLQPKFEPLPLFPAIERDLALVVDDSVTWEKITATIASAGAAELEAVRPVSVYRGKQIPAGKKSVALRLVFRRTGGTLKHEEADAMQSLILAALKSLGAELRA
jgi:phenylalanyl-tRNA synthetase beta chain